MRSGPEDRRAFTRGLRELLTEPIGGQLGCDLLGGGGRGPVELGEVKGAVFGSTRQEAEEVADVADRLAAMQAGAGEKGDEGGVGEGAVFAAQEVSPTAFEGSRGTRAPVIPLQLVPSRAGDDIIGSCRLKGCGSSPILRSR
jgi:hypothetical protein